MSTQPSSLRVEKIRIEKVPVDIRAAEHNQAIYRAANLLRRIAAGTALRIQLNGFTPKHAQKCIHSHFRSATKRVRTRVKDGYIYVWLEDKSLVKYERTPIPVRRAQERTQAHQTA